MLQLLQQRLRLRRLPDQVQHRLLLARTKLAINISRQQLANLLREHDSSLKFRHQPPICGQAVSLSENPPWGQV